MNKLNWIIFGVLAALLAVLFNGALSHVVYWNEQHQLFLFSDIYFKGFLSQPSGILSYITSFCVQFFYHPVLGGIILSVFLSAVFLLNAIIVRKLSKKHDKFLFSLLPALFLAVQYCSIYYPVSVVIGLVLNQLIFLLFILLPSSLRKYLFLIFLLAAFYISGVYSILFIVYLTIYSFTKKDYWTPILVIAGFFILLFTASYYYRVSLSVVLNAGLAQSGNIVLLALFLPSFISAYYLSAIFPIKKIPAILTFIVLIGVYTSGTMWRLFEKHNYHTRLMLNVDKHVRAEEWAKVLELTPKYQGKNQIVCCLNNLALHYTGRMPDDMFYYPQDFGVNSLYPLWSGDTKAIEYGDLIFAGLGYYNEATRWAFEAMTIYGETPPTLMKLAKYNAYNHKPLVAQKFINILKQSLFYSEWASNQEKLLSEQPAKQAIKHDATHSAIFANFVNITNDLLYLCDKEHRNKMAFEYLMANYLLGNRVVEFVNNLWRIDTLSYKKMPKTYEEALLIFGLMYPEELDTLEWKVNEDTKNRFKQYSALYANSSHDELKSRFGGTYWYYIHFKSPYGNKIITQ